ncbi:MAG: helix-turn-helix domain-containing protein [Eubacteriales bacterium]|jgi:hypothetical protein
MTKEKTTPDYNNLPLILTPKDVQIALGLPDNQINQVYRLFKSKKFPSEKIGGKYIIPKPRFLTWLGESRAIK